jgi:hypothetical protein
VADKFIPTGDAPFAKKAHGFAAVIGRAPQRFGVSREDADALVRAVEEFEALRLAARNKYTRSKRLLDERDNARDKVKRMMERLGRMIRANDQLDRADTVLLGIGKRPARLRKSTCPQTRPRLFYMGSRHSRRVGRKVHVLRFQEPWTKMGDPICGRRMAKPAGAWGVAVYVELIDEGEKIPSHPGELSGGRPWLLQLSTRGPIEAEFPVADRPMRVVYWARWVGMKGDMGPFSQTCVGEFEGPMIAHRALVDQTIARRRAQTVIITTARMALPDEVEEIEALPGAEQRLLTDEAA